MRRQKEETHKGNDAAVHAGGWVPRRELKRIEKLGETRTRWAAVPSAFEPVRACGSGSEPIDCLGRRFIVSSTSLDVVSRPARRSV